MASIPEDSSNRSAARLASVVAVVVLVWTWVGRPASPSSGDSPAYRVDINSASWVELLDVEGVGDTLAMRIVESRQAEGPFVSIDDLTRVRGIGEISKEKMRPFLRVDE